MDCVNGKSGNSGNSFHPDGWERNSVFYPAWRALEYYGERCVGERGVGERAKGGARSSRKDNGKIAPA